jgi:hypothetical protein
MPRAKEIFPSATLGTRAIGSSAGALQPDLKAHKDSGGMALLFVFSML